MRLVDEVLSFHGSRVVCRAEVRADMIFVEDGRVSSLYAVELFAQTAGIWAALSVRSRASITRDVDASMLSMGALVGCREITFDVDSFDVGDVLEIHCEHQVAIGTTAQLRCELHRAGVRVAAGSINVMAGGLAALGG